MSHISHCYSKSPNGISANPAKAETGKERGKKAERTQVENWKPFWKASSVLRSLLILSTLVPTQRRKRLTHHLRTLRRCLETRRLSATRKLGRLFLTPSMNSCPTWTSRVRMTGRNCSGPQPTRTDRSSSKASLRLVQKTSGLFDTVKAGNDSVAGKASTPTVDTDPAVGPAALQDLLMDPLARLGPGGEESETLGGLFQATPLELTEADYLDSFMDLSNFLNQEGLTGPEPAVCGAGYELEEMTEKVTDFSDLHSLLQQDADTVTIVVDNCPPTVAVTVTPAQSSTAKPSRKRKTADSVDADTLSLVSNETPAGVYDHDYVSKSKKLKKAPVEEDDELAPSTSKSPATRKSGTHYRERRDKNNIASRRSRQIRKQKFVDMDQEADRLTSDNERLRKKIEELEGLAKIMKAELIKKMTDK